MSIFLEAVDVSKCQYLKLLIKLVVCLLKEELTGTLELLGYCSGNSLWVVIWTAQHFRHELLPPRGCTYFFPVCVENRRPP